MIKICKSASVSYQYDDKSIFLQYCKYNVDVPKLHTNIYCRTDVIIQYTVV